MHAISNKSFDNPLPTRQSLLQNDSAKALDPNLRPPFTRTLFSDDPPGEPIKGFQQFSLGTANVFVDTTGNRRGISCEHCNDMHMMCFACFKKELDGIKPDKSKGPCMDIAAYPSGQDDHKCCCDDCIAQRPNTTIQPHHHIHPTSEEQRPLVFPGYTGPVVRVVLLPVESLPAHRSHCKTCPCSQCCHQCREHRTVERFFKEEKGEIEDKMERAVLPFVGEALRVLCWCEE